MLETYPQPSAASSSFYNLVYIQISTNAAVLCQETWSIAQKKPKYQGKMTGNYKPSSVVFKIPCLTCGLQYLHLQLFISNEVLFKQSESVASEERAEALEQRVSDPVLNIATQS